MSFASLCIVPILADYPGRDSGHGIRCSAVHQMVLCAIAACVKANSVEVCCASWVLLACINFDGIHQFKSVQIRIDMLDKIVTALLNPSVHRRCTCSTASRGAPHGRAARRRTTSRRKHARSEPSARREVEETKNS